MRVWIWGRGKGRGVRPRPAEAGGGDRDLVILVIAQTDASPAPISFPATLGLPVMVPFVCTRWGNDARACGGCGDRNAVQMHYKCSLMYSTWPVAGPNSPGAPAPQFRSSNGCAPGHESVRTLGPVTVLVCLTTPHGCQTQPAADVRLSRGLPRRQPESSGDNFMQVTVSGGKLHP